MSLNLPSINSASVISIVGECEPATVQNFTSSLIVKKDLVLSPLTRIAKGMQSLGLNLRSSNQSTEIIEDPNQEPNRQNQQKLQTRTRIIEL